MFKTGKELEENVKIQWKKLNNSLLIKFHEGRSFIQWLSVECTVKRKHISSINFFMNGREHHF